VAAGVTGFHHVTCVASGPQRNIDFYAGVLGMRLVKRTVHFDNAHVYHLYYGDEKGSVGSLLTFFPFPDPEPARRGSGSIAEVGLAVPGSARDYWARRFSTFHVDADRWTPEFGEPVLRFRDHDGQRLKLIAIDDAGNRTCWSHGDVPEPFAIRGVQGVRLGIDNAAPTLDVLIEQFGLVRSASSGTTTRLRFPDRRDRRHVDVEAMPGVARAPAVPLEGVLPLAGTANHVAFGTAGSGSQLALKTALEAAGHVVTPVKDRMYFRSIYMLEPGGIRLEVANDDCAGFLLDESVAYLGTALKLPPWLEDMRAKYEQELPPIHAPDLIA